MSKETKLKVGDKVVRVWTHFSQTNYDFQEVVRLTPTLAILGNCKKLKNESVDNSIWRDKDSYIDSFKVIGGNYGERYIFSTDEIISESNAEQKKIKIENWFYKFNPTFEQKEQIYNLFATKK